MHIMKNDIETNQTQKGTGSLHESQEAPVTLSLSLGRPENGDIPPSQQLLRLSITSVRITQRIKRNTMQVTSFPSCTVKIFAGLRKFEETTMQANTSSTLRIVSCRLKYYRSHRA